MDRLIALAGMAAIIGTALLLSNNRKAIRWKLVAIGLGLQCSLALLILKVPGTRDAFFLMGQGVEKLLECALEGAAFVFGDELAKGKQFIFLVRVGASIIFVAGLSSVLYHLGIMQRLIKGIAGFLTRALGISAPEAVSTAAAVFVGQVECQLLIKPYFARLTMSQLFCTITAAMATISGSALVAYTAIGMNATYLIAASIMSAVGGIVMAKIFWPETDERVLAGVVELEELPRAANVFDAAAIGASDGARVAMNVMVMVCFAVAAIALVNMLLGGLLSFAGLSWQIQDILGVFFTPVAFLLGVPYHEAFYVGRLIAVEILINEFASYGELSKVIAGAGPYVLSAKTQVIATCALCGFANLGSVAINIGGLGAMTPERRGDVARVAFRALVAANFATWMTAAIAGIFF